MHPMRSYYLNESNETRPTEVCDVIYTIILSYSYHGCIKRFLPVLHDIKNTNTTQSGIYMAALCFTSL